jgi:hypothetical protein
MHAYRMVLFRLAAAPSTGIDHQKILTAKNPNPRVPHQSWSVLIQIAHPQLCYKQLVASSYPLLTTAQAGLESRAGED